MPIYTQRCLKCGNIFDDFRLLKDFENNPRCQFPDIDNKSKCHGESNRIIVNGGGGINVFKPQWFEHIAPDPIFIESKKQLNAECKKRGLASIGYG